MPCQPPAPQSLGLPTPQEQVEPHGCCKFTRKKGRPTDQLLVFAFGLFKVAIRFANWVSSRISHPHAPEISHNPTIAKFFAIRAARKSRSVAATALCNYKNQVQNTKYVHPQLKHQDPSGSKGFAVGMSFVLSESALRLLRAQRRPLLLSHHESLTEFVPEQNNQSFEHLI